MHFALLLILHWVADFVLQTDYEATNKSKSFKILCKHTMLYAVVVTAVYGTLFQNALMIVLTLVWLFVTHTAIDFVTSRWTSKLYSEGKRHDFFVVIGFDQLLHNLTLLAISLYM
ncbi:MAG TPA: DUF3307 domain-containing protein [Desulfobacterales bacterium]|nr:DUF3307 domain-containing protein [Desulfobacterales bacterium]